MKPSILIITLAMAIVGCKKDDDTNPLADQKAQFIANYADIVLAGYEDSHAKAAELQTAVNDFLAAPSEAGFTAAKNAWLAAREPYGQTEAFRFSGGPIDDEDGPEGELNSWPLDENYIDYVQGAPNSGIINDPINYPTITAEVLRTLNEVGGETNISLGYHAIEFLLWGQDLSASSAGMRPYTDYVTSGGTADNQDRRGDYLAACAQLLEEDLSGLVDEWQAGGSYRTTFLATDNDVAITHILTGLGTLSKSELAGERMFTALDNQDQEDEQSCFSDNTDRDIVTDAMGIHNVIQGTYTRTDGSVVSGYSLIQLLAEKDATLSAELDALSDDVIAKVNLISDPFDQAIMAETAGGNGPIMQAIRALQDQGDLITEAADALGLTVSTTLPE
ncbi:MAG: peptidase M75 [Flavobacteriales bacterium]|nr:peptidase M75 [Flavobacteriales bacterium]